MDQTGVYRRSFPEDLAPVLSVKGGAGVGTNHSVHAPDVRKETKASNGSVAKKFSPCWSTELWQEW